MILLRRLLAILLAFVSATPTLAAPALWKVANGNTTIYLFGTIHALPEGYQWRGPVLEKAFASADTLVIETLIDKDPTAITRLFPAPNPSLPPILERVPEKSRKPLAELMAKAGFTPTQLDRMPTWQAAFMMMGAMMRDLGVDRGAGVEQSLDTSFTGGARKVEGLETTSQQLGYFATLSEADQRELLTGMVDGSGDASTDYSKLIAAWSSGDEKALAKLVDDDEDLSPHVRDVLLKQRNANWAKWVKARLDRPGTVLVAVGAGHLTGATSVQALLKKDGVKVERVQ
jgi:uncharacterized protein YbaP (TraB family)